MRFKATLAPTPTFYRLIASLSSLGAISWLRLTSSLVRFTVIPEVGTQVWAALGIETLFEGYSIQSAANENTINLEVPLAALLAALRSASNSSTSSANIRLTKKDGVPYLCLTIISSSYSTSTLDRQQQQQQQQGDDEDLNNLDGNNNISANGGGEAIITQDIPVRVLSPDQVAGLHEPRCREPDVHIYLPPLSQLKSISDRFAKLSSSAASSSYTSTRNGANGWSKPSGGGGGGAGGSGPQRLELSATMHGALRLSVASEGVNISSTWKGLINPELDASEVDLPNHPSTLMRESGDWATVRIDARDWSRVLSVGRLGGRVIACFAHGHALILYVYLDSPSGAAAEEVGGGSVLTYYVSSYAS